MSTTKMCIVCLDETDAYGVDAIACSNGHIMHDRCFEQYLLMQTDKLAHTNSLVVRANSSSSDRAFLEGRICCPSFNCSAKAFGDDLIARLVSPWVFEVYIENRSRLAMAQQIEAALQTVTAAETVSKSDLPTSSDLATSSSLVAAAALAASLKNTFPNARMCGRCFFGPIVNDACSDLASHHRERNPHDDAKSDNSCPRCAWFSPDWDCWPKWDGKAPEATASLTFADAIESWRSQPDYYHDDSGEDQGDGECDCLDCQMQREEAYGENERADEEEAGDWNTECFCQLCGDGNAEIKLVRASCWRCLSPHSSYEARCPMGDGEQLCEVVVWCYACDDNWPGCSICAEENEWAPLSCMWCSCLRETDVEGREVPCGCEQCEETGCWHEWCCDGCDEKLERARDAGVACYESCPINPVQAHSSRLIRERALSWLSEVLERADAETESAEEDEWDGGQELVLGGVDVVGFWSRSDRARFKV